MPQQLVKDVPNEGSAVGREYAGESGSAGRGSKLLGNRGISLVFGINSLFMQSECMLISSHLVQRYVS